MKTLLSAVFLCICVLYAGANAQAREPIQFLTPEKEEVLRTISCLAGAVGHDPYELIAIAGTETHFTPNLVSAGNYGLMQINCSAQAKRLKKRLGIDNCRKSVSQTPISILAAVDVIRRMRNPRYRSCTGKNLYACYNGGPGWRKANRSRAMRYRVLALKYEARARKEWSSFVDPYVEDPHANCGPGLLAGVSGIITKMTL